MHERINARLPQSLLLALTLLLSLTLNLPAVEPGKEILLWSNGAPGSEGKTGNEKVRITDNGERVVSNIHKRGLTPYLPPADKATGWAVIVAPGGGHRAGSGTLPRHTARRVMRPPQIRGKEPCIASSGRQIFWH